jgi:hypothetical protein
MESKNPDGVALIRIVDSTLRRLDRGDLNFPSLSQDVNSMAFYCSLRATLNFLKRSLAELPRPLGDNPAVLVIEYSHIDILPVEEQKKRYREPRIHLRGLLIGFRSLFLRWDGQPLTCNRNNDFEFCRKNLTQRSYLHHNMLPYLRQFSSRRVISTRAQYGSLIFQPLVDGSTAIIPVHSLSKIKISFS